VSEPLAKFGKDCVIQNGCVIGFKYHETCGPSLIGASARIRTGTIIYGDVSIGDHFQSGHNALVRENTRIGDHVVIGTNSIIDGNTEIGDFVKIESNCYIPTHVKIGSRVFFGPNVTLTNDKYPLKLRDKYKPDGPVIEDGVTLGAGVVVLPGICIGADSMISAGAVVTHDIPPKSLVTGIPGRVAPLPSHLCERNMALSWKKYIND